MVDVASKPVADADRAVVRMFADALSTVRWETRIVEGRGLDLRIFGPGALRLGRTFPDAIRLVEYQVHYERQLLASGYSLVPVSERRSGFDRRRSSRATSDRRQP